MSQRTEVTVNGVTVFIKKFDPFLAVAIAGDLQKLVIGPAGAMFSYAGGQAGIDTSDYSIERAIEKLSGGLDGEALVKLARKLINPEYISLQTGEMSSPVKATEGNVNQVFTEDPFGSLIQVMTEIVKINYTDFFRHAQSLFGQVKGSLEKT